MSWLDGTMNSALQDLRCELVYDTTPSVFKFSKGFPRSPITE